MSAHTMRWLAVPAAGRLRQLWYAPLLAAAMGLMMARMLILARLLPLQQFAQFSAGMLISSTFCMLGCFGLQSLLQREWPVNLIRRQEGRGLVLAAQCNLVAVGCAVAALLGAASGVMIAGIPPPLLALGVVHGLSQQMFLIATVESRSRGNAVRYSWQNLARSVLTLGLGTAVAVATDSAQWVLAVESGICFAISIKLFSGSATRGALSVYEIYALAVRRLPKVKWSAALTLMAVATVSFMTMNADRWVASAALDVEGFGTYSFAWIVLMIAQAAQALINASAYPMLARRYASHGRQGAFRLCVQSSGAILVLGLLLVVPLWFGLEWAIRLWFPAYSRALALVPLFLVIGLLRVSDFWSSYLLITGRERRLLALNMGAALIGVAAWATIARPWSQPLQLMGVAYLAATLAFVSYVTAVGFAWQARV